MLLFERRFELLPLGVYCSRHCTVTAVWPKLRSRDIEPGGKTDGRVG
jgi:hypothetical protein